MANATPVHAKPKTAAKKPLSKDAQKIKEEQAEKNVPVADDKQLMDVEQPVAEVDNEESEVVNAPEVPEVAQQPLAGRPGTRTLADGTVLVNN